MKDNREESKKNSRKKKSGSFDLIVRSSFVESEMGKKIIEAKIRSASIEKELKGAKKKKKPGNK